MTREEIQNSREYLIAKAAVDYYRNHKNADIVSTFEDACEWADQNPIHNEDVDLDFQTFVKEMDAVFDLPSTEITNTEEDPLNWEYAIAKHYFKLGLKAQKGE